MMICVAYCHFGHLQVSLLCPLVVVSSPLLFHHHRCSQSTLQAGAHRHGVGVIPLHCCVKHDGCCTHFVSLPPHPHCPCLPPSTLQGVAHSSGSGYQVTPVTLFPLSWFAGPSSSLSPGHHHHHHLPSLSVLVSFCPIPWFCQCCCNLLLAVVGCWWPLLSSLPHCLFLSLSSAIVVLIHYPPCKQMLAAVACVGVLFWHYLMVNNIDRT